MSRTKLKPQRIADFPKPYRDTLAHWSAFRNLGFSADEIFFGFGDVSGQPDILHLQLQTQGKKFTVNGRAARSPRARRYSRPGKRSHWRRNSPRSKSETLATGST